MGFIVNMIKRAFLWLVEIIFYRNITSLSSNIKEKSRKLLSKQLIDFKRNNKRSPTGKELKWIIVNVSHSIIQSKSMRAHWVRQRIRKFLLEENGMDYKMK